MAPSLEMLFMFVQAASLGSFSATAQKLGKQQSTVSEAIANLEINLGIQLFDRRTRRPRLTEQGRALLVHAQQVIEANDRLTKAAHQLADGLEPQVTLVLSDTYQSDRFPLILTHFEQRYPELELKSMLAERNDVISLVQTGRAHLGLLAAQSPYPPDIGFTSLPDPSNIGLYVGKQHPLAHLGSITSAMLHTSRELRLSTYTDETVKEHRGKCWTASTYLLLLEMTELGFGWAELPHWLVQRFASNTLIELQVSGWPKITQVDVLWSHRQPLGPAGNWLLNALTHNTPW